MTGVAAEAGIRVVIADDHAVVRRGTRQILEQGGAGIRVVGEAGTGSEAVELVCSLSPDVAVLDIGMPGMNGVEATRRIRHRCPSVGVLVLTVETSAGYVWSAVEAGASGYLLKDSDDGALLEAVLEVAGGGSYLDKSLANTVMDRMRSGSPTEKPDTGLTPRELDVLRLAAVGASNREVAEQLGLSVRTIEVHMSHVLEKLDARSRTEAVVSAARAGILDLGGDG